ncbi:unnamed protein product [Brachionus calyciflorus]|uniref:2-phosphoxylose phosphatase 1 n=1 Tax=Brachionus calyciflorus TaxID=104777 RepID=A0A813MKB3_9BILA|nr:unnamed protein product [Brachionus calyciflorus]
MRNFMKEGKFVDVAKDICYFPRKKIVQITKNKTQTNMFDSKNRISISALCNLNRGLLFKVLGLSTLALMTFRLMHIDTYAYEKSKLMPNEKLVSVIMITRHGARTPLSIISKLDQVEYDPNLLEPFVKAKYKLKLLDNSDFDHDILSYYDELNLKNHLIGGIGRGQLTKVGEKQMFNLGRRVRQRYIEDLKFLSKDYKPSEIYTRSTHYKRTISSAKSVMAGIYLDSPEADQNDPFIINIQHLHEDVLFPNPINCSYYAEMHKFIQTLSLYTQNLEYIENLIHLNKVLKGSDEITESKNISFTAFRDDMLARQVHGLHVPKHLEEFVIKSDRYAAMELTAETKHNIKISCGRLLNLFKENFLFSYEIDSKNNGEDFHKFRYYSAHDSTLNALLAAFDLIDEEHSWPPFAADITIELWKRMDNPDNNTNDYFIKIFYCGKRLFLPNLPNQECSLDHFINVLDKNGVDKHGYDQLCNEKFSS